MLTVKALIQYACFLSVVFLWFELCLHNFCSGIDFPIKKEGFAPLCQGCRAAVPTPDWCSTLTVFTSVPSLFCVLQKHVRFSQQCEKPFRADRGAASPELLSLPLISVQPKVSRPGVRSSSSLSSTSSLSNDTRYLAQFMLMNFRCSFFWR